MKKIVCIIILITAFACSSESANDCFQTSGPIVQKELAVSAFNKILVNRNVELILTEATDYKVTITTGENLINDVSAVVVNDELQLTDTNTCNYVRDYNTTKIYVSAPNITEIRSSTQYDISSNGVLNYAELKLVSEDFTDADFFSVGDFRLQVNTTELEVQSNNLSFFYLSGTTNSLNIYFASGNGRFEGRNLIPNTVTLFHRGSNDMIVNPQMALTANLVSTGNVIVVNTPETLTIQEQFTGRVIFE